VVAHGDRAPDAGPSGDDLERQVSLLEEPLGEPDPLAEGALDWGCPGRRPEVPEKAPLAHAGKSGERRDRHLLVEVQRGHVPPAGDTDHDRLPGGRDTTRNRAA